MEKAVLESNFKHSDISESTDKPETFLADFLDQIRYPHLFRLVCNKNNSNLFENEKKRLQRPVSLVSLEMLEAELVNQGLIDKNQDSLAKFARHQISLLVWQARRLMLPLENIEFLIDVTELIIKLAYQAVSYSSGEINKNLSYSDNQLRYLEQFSAYLTGIYQTPTNKYEQGMNLVLKSISETNINSTDKTIKCVIPLSKTNFVEMLKSSTVSKNK
ncbi:MAG TPA: hypothetical protein PKA63_10120 [Oligoflexia bacterium]|nr:hypothetical protein [Oligoflexia bacterium]HMP49012.1 hypothetical protein [Oligoflexia bacterium]